MIYLWGKGMGPRQALKECVAARSRGPCSGGASTYREASPCGLTSQAIRKPW